MRLVSKLVRIYAVDIDPKLSPPISRGASVAKGTCLAIAIIAAVGARPFAYSQAAMQTYRLTDLNAPPNQSLVFTAINNSGQLTGSFTPSGATEMHAFIYDNGSITDLGTLGALGPASSAMGFSIDASGQVAGTATGTLTEQAFLSSGGALIGLGGLPGGGPYSAGAGINETERNMRRPD